MSISETTGGIAQNGTSRNDFAQIPLAIYNSNGTKFAARGFVLADANLNESQIWRKCSACKKPIGFQSRYYECSVSTCTNQRTGYVFCSVPCFEVHLPGARHRDAAAIEKTSPAREPVRKIVNAASTQGRSESTSSVQSKEVLIIASRLKDYVQLKGDMNTSAQVMDVLSDFVRLAADRAIENARADGRKTVMDRDFSFLKRG